MIQWISSITAATEKTMLQLAHDAGYAAVKVIESGVKTAVNAPMELAKGVVDAIEDNDDSTG